GYLYIGGYSIQLGRAAIDTVEFAYGNFYRTQRFKVFKGSRHIIIEVKYLLHGSLVISGRTNNHASFILLYRNSKYFRRRCAIAVHQHYKRATINNRG